MIYSNPLPSDPLDQADLIDGCPFAIVSDFRPDEMGSSKAVINTERAIILTQACDLANSKATSIVVAMVFDAEQLVLNQATNLAIAGGV